MAKLPVTNTQRVGLSPIVTSGERAKNFKFNQYNKDVNPLIYDAKIQNFLQFDSEGTPNLWLLYNFG
jgi:hypothetical protein